MKEKQPLWLLALFAYFFFGLVNGAFLGLTPEDERLNGLAQLMFFWSPFFVSVYLFIHSKSLKRKVLLGLTGITTIWFAAFPTILSGAGNMLVRGYNPDVKLVSSEQQSNWRICHYHFSPSSGFGEDNDFTTREKEVFPGIKIVRKVEK